MFEKHYFSQVLFFFAKFGLFPAAQSAYKTGRGWDDRLLTIYHHLQMSFDVGDVSYVVQLYVSAAFDTVSNNGLIYKLKFLAAGVRVPDLSEISDQLQATSCS